MSTLVLLLVVSGLKPSISAFDVSSSGYISILRVSGMLFGTQYVRCFGCQERS